MKSKLRFFLFFSFFTSFFCLSCENPLMTELLEPLVREREERGKPTAYTVTFNANGATNGTAPEAITVNVGGSITIPGNAGLERAGYILEENCWYTNASGTGTKFEAGDEYTPVSSITLYAKWTPITYTVVYDKNEASKPGAAVAGTTESSVHTYDAPKTLTPNGYSRSDFDFWRWNTKPDGSGTPYNDGAVVLNLSSEDGDTVTLYAQWAHFFTVTFNKNNTDAGGTNADPSSIFVVEGGLAAAPLSNPARAGYTFGGWYKEEDCVNAWNFAADTVTQNTDLYARWTLITYTVAYNANGGTGTMVSTGRTYNDGLPLPASTFNRTGYTFKEWNTLANGTGTAYSAGASDNLRTTAGTITLFAQWSPITYTVIYNANASDAAGTTADSTHTYDAYQNLTANGYSRASYAFSGWNTQPGGGGTAYANNASVRNLCNTESDSITLYAQWHPNTAGITLEVEEIKKVNPTFPAITIYRTNNIAGRPLTFTVTLAPDDYDADSISWEVAGVGYYADQSVKTSIPAFVLDASNVIYNTAGSHLLKLTLTISGLEYQVNIPFTIME